MMVPDESQGINKVNMIHPAGTVDVSKTTHPVVVEIFQTEPKWWTNLPADWHSHAMPAKMLAWLMKKILCDRTKHVKTYVKGKVVLSFFSSHISPNLQCTLTHNTKRFIPVLAYFWIQCPCAPKKRSIGKFLAITNNLQVHKVMSSECWVEPCSEGQAQGTGLEKQQGEEVKKEEVEVPCGDNQPVGSLRQEEPGRERPSSPDLEQVQRVETQTQEKRERFSHESRDRGSGLWRLKWDVKCDVFCCLCCLYCSITKYNTSHYNAVKKKKRQFTSIHL